MQAIKPKSYKLKMSQVLELLQAQQSFGGYNKVTGDEKSVIVPFDLDGLTRVALGLNVKDLRALAEAHADAVAELQKQHVPDGFDPKKATPEERTARITAMQAFNAEVKKLMEAEHEVKQRPIKLEALKPDVNPVEPSIFAMLDPILIVEAA